MDELIELADRGNEKEKSLAFSVLLEMRGRLSKDPRLQPEQRERLKQIALRYVRDFFPLDPGYSFFLILRALDASVADDYLAEELELREDWDKVLLERTLSAMIQNKKSFARLQQLSSRKDWIGERATYYLELSGHIDPAKLERLGAEFREKQTAYALNRLHSTLILHQVNRPIAPILKLLGEPTVLGVRGGRAHIYEAEGVQLYMEEDTNGNLSGLKIK